LVMLATVWSEIMSATLEAVPSERELLTSVIASSEMAWHLFDRRPHGRVMAVHVSYRCVVSEATEDV
jgi:hypothetical protein